MKIVLIYMLDGKLLMKPSKANVKAHLDKIREVIKANKMAKQANLIRLLNPILRGWANYHSHVVAKETFARVDTDVWSMLWRWAVRRHPNKGARWVKEKYFKTRGVRNWVFAVTEKQEDRTQRELTLLQESDTPIQRQTRLTPSTTPPAVERPDLEPNHRGIRSCSTKCRNRERTFHMVPSDIAMLATLDSVSYGSQRRL
jgi:Group II intron, maturase-specific domain